MSGMKSEHRTTRENREQVAFHHEFLVFLPFSLLLENWCFLCCSSSVGIYNLLQGNGRQRAAGSYGMGSFEKRSLYNWKQSITSPLAARESWFSFALSSQFTPVQIKCRTALAGAWVWCCCGCLQPSGRKRGELEAVGGGCGSVPDSGAAIWVSHPRRALCPGRWGVLAGCRVFRELLGATNFLLKLTVLCFIFHSINMLTVILNLCIWEGVGRKRGYSAEGMGCSSLPVPPAHCLSTIPWLPTRISSHFIYLPDQYEKWSRIQIAFMELEKEKCKSAFTKSRRRRVRPAA